MGRAEPCLFGLRLRKPVKIGRARSKLRGRLWAPLFLMELMRSLNLLSTRPYLSLV
jgi:hypothetical protein